MGNLAIIFDSPGENFTLHSTAAAQLADLGVTRVSVLRDEASIAIVLEGWTFDTARSASEVEKALLGGTGRGRVLRELAQMRLSPT